MALSNAANVSLLFIIGGDEADRVVEQGSKIRVTGSSDLWRLINDEPHHRLHVSRNYFRQGRQPELDQYRILLNLITEPEHNSRTLENLRKLLRGVHGKVVNRPEAVLRSTRDQVARQLSGIDGLIVPPTVRIPKGKAKVAAHLIAKAGMKPRIILRSAGTHSGKIAGLFDSEDEVVAALDGSDAVATQFIDFSSSDGLYRKYRVFFIGPHLVLRHMLVSDHWNVHAKDRNRFMAERPELVAEERALFEDAAEPFSPEIRDVLSKVRERMSLDFFGMDFGITRDGQVVLFEANATMSFFPFAADPQFEYLTRCVRPARSAVQELLGLSSDPARPLDINWRMQPA